VELWPQTHFLGRKEAMRMHVMGTDFFSFTSKRALATAEVGTLGVKE